MSGHSKWATTKHKKAVIDARRAKSFAKLIKNIEVAARIGGPDVAGNPALELAITKAKKTSVPNDNIDRAVKRGSGQLGEAVDYQTIMYEGYGPQGTALLIECLTDNKNRAASDVRLAVGRNGGTMADPGSVSYLFTRKGIVSVPKAQGAEAGSESVLTEDDLLMAVLDAGAEEVKEEGENFTVISDPKDLPEIRTALNEAGLEYDNDEAGFVPSMHVQLETENAKKFVRIYDALEDLDDVQNVYSNADMSAEVMAQLEED
ncbi:YebC/PmpR family DNA-binding transcriptional regulator [Acaricomes phytoseiuli]|uniref:YebC/PmpR family DNA-binding transcriptional regulator n=1 Tax=Acaricomes phytoseiuli TaxID=291968 RepID=UPI000378F1EA|nr:YebC/PmpR family DNA-binding transcriptional regulator [Acaricomes phytoseiuli]MCW1249888.1 YebC/PmpR family DNA-binding transcriptional regulator [Acaricomes phytoseiuli]